jgi:NEDD8-activating enzyme E1 regulatory subunit
MKAQSKVYVKLQGLYKAKARQDAQEVLQTVRATPGGENVDPAEVDLFCKNASFVKLVNASADGRNLQDVLGTRFPLPHHHDLKWLLTKSTISS